MKSILLRPVCRPYGTLGVWLLGLVSGSIASPHLGRKKCIEDELITDGTQAAFFEV
jgi:hypothetical protein